MLSVEFLSPQNGSAWKWGPTSRQTPFLVTPGILGNKNSSKSWWSTFGHLPPPKSPVEDPPPATPQVDSGPKHWVLRSHNPPACCMVLPMYLDRQNRWVSKVTFKPSASPPSDLRSGPSTPATRQVRNYLEQQHGLTEDFQMEMVVVFKIC